MKYILHSGARNSEYWATLPPGGFIPNKNATHSGAGHSCPAAPLWRGKPWGYPCWRRGTEPLDGEGGRPPGWRPGVDNSHRVQSDTKGRRHSEPPCPPCAHTTHTRSCTGRGSRVTGDRAVDVCAPTTRKPRLPVRIGPAGPDRSRAGGAENGCPSAIDWTRLCWPDNERMVAVEILAAVEFQTRQYVEISGGRAAWQAAARAGQVMTWKPNGRCRYMHSGSRWKRLVLQQDVALFISSIHIILFKLLTEMYTVRTVF